MYIFEITDKCINIYNQKKKELNKEIIPQNIIVNNKIYDFIKFVKELEKIVYKYKVINNLFKVKVTVIIFEKLNPSEEYLIKLAFNKVANINAQIIYVNQYFENNYIFISGDLLYIHNHILNHLNKGTYILIGNSLNYFDYIKKLTNKYKVKILEYENSNTIIYEKV